MRIGRRRRRKEIRHPGKTGAPDGKRDLLDFDLGTGGFDLFLDLFGFSFGDAALEHFGSAFDKGLGFGEAETGYRAANFLNDSDLVRAAFSKDNIEFGLFFFLFSDGRSATTTGRSSGADAPLFFEGFYELGSFEDGESAEVVNDLS